MNANTMLLNPVRLTTLLLLLFLVVGRHSTASTQQDENIRAGDYNDASSGEALLDNVVAATCARENMLPGGQKMAFYDVKKLHKEKVNGARGETTKISSETLNEEGEQSLRSLLSEERKMADFVAFHEDYSGPNYHPPKNN